MVQETQENSQEDLPNCEDYIKDIPFACRALYVIMLIIWSV